MLQHAELSDGMLKHALQGFDLKKENEMNDQQFGGPRQSMRVGACWEISDCVGSETTASIRPIQQSGGAHDADSSGARRIAWVGQLPWS